MGSIPTIGLNMKLFWKTLISAALFILLLILSVPQKQNLKYGVTFSQKFSAELVGAGWKKNYLEILDELKVKDLRLVAYWDLIEPEKERFNFNDLDWQIAEAEKRGAKIILAMGRKTPRWPECHEPDWARGKTSDVKSKKTLDVEERAQLLNYIKTTIEHYKSNSAIWAWQVENEPLFPFGKCGTTPISLLNQATKLVKSLSDKPVILTDSGELGFAWPYLTIKSDIFGTTLYRHINNRFLGDIKYSLIPAAYFRLKAGWAKLWGKEIIISELQAEPWATESLRNVPLEWQNKTMNPEIFKEIIGYTERSGFPKAYLWGVEWWYWMKEKQGKPEMWDAVEALSANSLPAGRQGTIRE